MALLMVSCEDNDNEESASSYELLKQGFKSPPREARPRALWDWVDGNFSLKEITREMEEAVEKGMGGFDIWDVSKRVDEHDIVPAGPPFMSDAYMEGIVHAIHEAERLGLDLGLIIASGWNAGGSWIEPRHQTMGLYRSSVTTQGGSIEKMKIPFPELPDKAGKKGRKVQAIIKRGEDGLPVYYKDIAVLAVSLKNGTVEKMVDLTDSFSPVDGITTTLPKGDWTVTRYVCTNTGQPMISQTPNSKGPMIDHFSQEATKFHLNYFFDRLEEYLDEPVANSGLTYLYTDSYEVVGQLWTPSLADEFKKRTGYSLVPYLPVMDGFEVGDAETTMRFMYDFRKVLSDLIIENHYQKATEMCEERGISFVAEAAGPGWPIHNCPFESLKSSGSLSFPRGEFWHLPEDPFFSERGGEERRQHYLQDLQVIKGVASASHMYDQKYVEAEAFTGTHLWIEGPGDLKRTADRAFCEGLNRINFHTWPHTPEEAGEPGWIYPFGTLHNENRIWWPMARPWMEYLGRNSFMLQQGNFVGDVLFFYGDSAPNFVKAKHIDPSLGFGYDYDVTNTDILVNKLTVEEGRLVLPHGPSYEVLVLPEEDYMLPAIVEKVMELAKKGATIVGPKPVRSHGLFNSRQNDSLVRVLADSLWGECDGVNILENEFGKGRVVWGKSIRRVLHEKGVDPDFSFIGNSDSTGIDYIHRRQGDNDFYLIRNTTDSAFTGEGTFRVSGKRPEYWNPVTGQITPCKLYDSDRNSTTVALNLSKYGSIYVVFSDRKVVPHYTSFTINGKKYFSPPSFRTTDSLRWWLWLEDNPALMFARAGQFQLEDDQGRKRDFQISKGTSVQEVGGPWRIEFPRQDGPLHRIEADTLKSWTEYEDHFVRFYSGIATYSTEINLDSTFFTRGFRYYLDLGEVCEIAHVIVNRSDSTVLWTPVKTMDVTEMLRPGANIVEVHVANTWHNKLAGESRKPEDERDMKTNITRLPNAWSYPMEDVPNEDYQLKESGLIGPVTLVGVPAVLLEEL